MNNRYICKAKRKDNGEWVEGVAIFADNKAFILNNAKVEFIKGFNENRLNFVLVEVIPETVGQCTGLEDKNGKLMYTGDIINALLDFGMPIKSVCAFRDGSFGLFAKQHGAEHFHPFTSLCNISYEIIGNIHDNPELLEVER